jgi:protocatechuate 3,4-dioxygenase beta subunit
MKSIYYTLGVLLCMLVVAQPTHAQMPPMPVPMNLVAEVRPSDPPVVRLSWEIPATTMPLRGLFFKIYRSMDDELHFGPINVSATTRYADERVLPGHTYYYYVTSVTLIGTMLLESPPSNTASATIPGPATRPHGIISGTVVDSLDGTPIPNASVQFFSISKQILWIPQVLTGADGFYRAVLDTGTYLVHTVAAKLVNAPGPMLYKPEWYENAADPRSATPVLVSDASAFTANFDLVPLRFPPPPLATISGTVTDDEDPATPLQDATVVIVRTMQDWTLMSSMGNDFLGFCCQDMNVEGLGYLRGVIWKGTTDANGEYSASVPDNYSYLAMATKRGYIPEFYDNKTDPSEADIIKLNGSATGIDFSLTPRPTVENSISGTVNDSDGVGVPSRIILLPARPVVEPLRPRFEYTDADGMYKITNVRPGTYLILAIPFEGYAPAFYKEGAYGVIYWQEADKVEIPVTGDVTGIDIGVVPIMRHGFAQMFGRIFAGAETPVGTSSVPIMGVNVLAKDDLGNVVGYGITDDTGAYVIESLPAGQISIQVDCPDYVPAQVAITIGATDYLVSRDFTLVPSTPTAVPGQGSVPSSFALDQNYPNPFNPSTSIRFSLPQQSTVVLKIFNLLGQKVATLAQGVRPAGTYQVSWNGTDDLGRSVGSGLYFYRLTAVPTTGGEGFSHTKKMTLVK